MKLDNENKIYDLTDYAVAKAVVEDFPKIMKIYETLLPALAHYQHYLAVSSVMLAVEDSQTLMKMQLDQFKTIHENRGKVTKDGE